MKDPRFQSKKVAVLGLGASGSAAARLLHAAGAEVTMLDSDAARDATALRDLGVNVVLGPEAETCATLFDLAVLSPGIDPVVPLVRAIRDRGMTVIGELELAWRFCQCPVVAITGTNGKTTTTQLIDALFNAAGVPCRVAGNIGPAFSGEAAASAELQIMAVEVSSFQLETITSFRPAIAVWLNFRPDHLDRYPDVEAYREAKLHLFDYQTPEDWAVVKWNDPLPPLTAQMVTFSAFERGGDFDLREGMIHYRDEPVLAMAETRLRGLHNAENLMAALAVGMIRGLSWETMRPALSTFTPAAHRCEPIRVLDGVEYVNDSKATNLDALEKALMSEQRPVVLIAGGKDKGFPFDELTPLIGEKVREAVLIGQMAQRIEASWREAAPCQIAGSLADAVATARQIAQEGDVVLFSPGTSSFDMFTSYADRGNQFRALVEALQPQAPES